MLRIRAGRLLLVLCAASSALAQGVVIGGKVPQTPNVPGGTLTGIVTLADTHAPARGAVVMVIAIPSADGKGQSGNSGGGGRTGIDGRYLIQHVPPGEYTVIALMPGYVSFFEQNIASNVTEWTIDDYRAGLKSNGTVEVKSGGIASLDVSLARGAAISGRVLYSDGSPASQVIIRIEDPAKDSGKDGPRAMGMSLGALSMMTGQSLATDDEGHFRVSGLTPGKYRVAAVQSLGGGSSGPYGIGAIVDNRNDTAALVVYAGNTLHRKSARVYDLRGGDETPGIDILIPLDALHEVHGSVSAKDGRTLNAGTVTLTDDSDDTLRFSTKLAEDGTFAFASVPSGTYKLALSGAAIAIHVLPPNAPRDFPLELAPTHTTNSFADTSVAVIVKDSNVEQVALTPDEVPVPKDADKNNPSSPFGGATEDQP
jgi:hypothetical protein